MSQEIETRKLRLRLWVGVGMGLVVIWFLGVLIQPTTGRFLLLVVSLMVVVLIGIFMDLILQRYERLFYDMRNQFTMGLTGRQVDHERRLRQTLATINRKLLDELHTDDLTGLHNRRSFERFVDSILHSETFRLKPLSLVMIDLDRFKAINENYGHSGGDQLLKALARRWKSMIRGSDLLARLGGEEFCLVLPNTTLAQAGLVAEKIRAATQSMPVEIAFKSGTVSVRTTISMGVATADDIAILDIKDLLNAADHALYEAKHSGRNLTVKRRFN